MSKQLEQLFRECFAASHATELLGGAVEPLYQPATQDGELHRIYYREDFFASALHEVAHWCIAGEERRQQLDYSYWYAPDGRDASQQRAFEQVEVKPQAVEWHFALASSQTFRISADNLSGDSGDITDFAEAVRRQAERYCRLSLPSRAQVFRLALAAHFGGVACPDASCFVQDRAA